MFAKLGIADEMKDKARKIPATPVGESWRARRRNRFQQISELKPVAGIDIVGRCRMNCRRSRFFQRASPASQRAQAGKALIKFLPRRGPSHDHQQRNGAIARARRY